MTRIDDRAVGLCRAIRSAPDQKAGNGFDGLLGGREADPLHRPAAKAGETLERKQQMGTALVGRQSMDLVDDHGPRGLEHRAAGFGPEQHVKGLRRRDHDVRRSAPHAVALARGGIAGAHRGPDLDVRQPPVAQRLADAGERRLEVALNIVR